MPDQPLINDGNYRGFQDANIGPSEFNTLAFIINQFIRNISTATLVKVVAVSNSGGLTKVGYVDIVPLVNQVDGAGNATPHGVISACPYFRMQGGGNALILDPQVGDIGIAVFADHDLSSVIANRDAILASGGNAKVRTANPGSRRRFDMTDALYLGGLLNGVPTQYVQFSASGVRIHSPVMITLDAPTILMNAQTISLNATTSMDITTPTLTITGNVATTGTLTNNGVNVGSTHLHSGVSTGINNSGPPI